MRRTTLLAVAWRAHGPGAPLTAATAMPLVVALMLALTSLAPVASASPARGLASAAAPSTPAPAATSTPDPAASTPATAPANPPTAGATLAAVPANPPTAVGDLVQTHAGATVDVDVLANDLDVDRGSVNLTVSVPPTSGSADVVGQVIRYTSPVEPTADALAATSADSFTYRVTDSAGRESTAVVAVTVLPQATPTGRYRVGRAYADPEPIVAGQQLTVASAVEAEQDDGSFVPAPVGTVFDVLFRIDGTSIYTAVRSDTVRQAGRAESVVTAVRDGAWRIRVGTTQSTGDLVDVHTPSSTVRVGRADVTPEPLNLGATGTLQVGLQTRYSDGVYRPSPVGTLFTVRFRPKGRVLFSSVGTGRVTNPGVARVQVSPDRDGTYRLRVGAVEGLGDGLDVLIPRSAGLNASVVGPLVRDHVPYAYRAGCPVPPSGLRRVTVNFLDYDGLVQRGDLILRADAVDDVVHVFGRALAGDFPVRRMFPADFYYSGGRVSPSGSDIAAMNDGNTSAFNCRPVTGNPFRLSNHSYGIAIDINTWENPYVTSTRFYPAGAGAYLDRSPYRKGMLVPGGPVPVAMSDRGWPWGARWRYPDYQHFSANGG